MSPATPPRPLCVRGFHLVVFEHAACKFLPEGVQYAKSVTMKGGDGGTGEDVLMSPPSAVEATAIGAGEENGGVPQAAPRVEMGYEPRYQRCVRDEAGSGVTQNARRSGDRTDARRIVP